MVEHLDGNRIIFLTDRSAAELDDKCGMAFYWNRLHGGMGIVPKVDAVALRIGAEIHKDLATIAEMPDISPEAIQAAIDELTSTITLEDHIETKRMEMLYRRLGWLAAFALYIEPGIRRVYENVAIEEEIVLDRDPLWVVTTPDRLLRHRDSGIIEYREYKSTISAGYKWMESWPYAIQLHIGLAAAEEDRDVPVKFAQVMGLLKGWTSEDGKLMHPYTWAYQNTKNGAWSCTYERGSEWIKVPVWDYPGGVVKWVQFCGEDIARAQFPHSRPVFLNKPMLDDWVQRRLRRERQIHGLGKDNIKASHALKVMYFEKRTRNCKPPFGDACPYLGPCWNAAIAEDPLKTGDFEVRTPHHEMEIIGVEG